MDYLRLKDTVNDLENQVRRSEQSAIQATKPRNEPLKESSSHSRHHQVAGKSQKKPHKHHDRLHSNRDNWSSRNRNLMRMLDRIHVEASTLAARTENLKLVKHTQELNVMKKWHKRNLLQDSSLITYPSDGPPLLTQLDATTAQLLDERERFRTATTPGAAMPIVHHANKTLLPPSRPSTLQRGVGRREPPLIVSRHRDDAVPTFSPSLTAPGEISDEAKSDFAKYLSEINQFPGTFDNRNDVIIDRRDHRRPDNMRMMGHRGGEYSNETNYTTAPYLLHPSSLNDNQSNNNNNNSLGFTSAAPATNADPPQPNHQHFTQVVPPHHQRHGAATLAAAMIPDEAHPMQPYITYGGKRWVLDETPPPQLHFPTAARSQHVDSSYSVVHKAPHCSRAHLDDVDNAGVLLVTPIQSNVSAGPYLAQPARAPPLNASDNAATLYAAWLEARWAKRAAEERDRAEMMRTREKRYQPLNPHDDYAPDDDAYFTSATRPSQLSPKNRKNKNNTQQQGFMSSQAYPPLHQDHCDAVNLNTISGDGGVQQPAGNRVAHVAVSLNARNVPGGPIAASKHRHHDNDDMVSTSHVPSGDQVVSISNASATNAPAINSNESDAIKAIRHDDDDDETGPPEDPRTIYDQKMTDATSAPKASTRGLVPNDFAAAAVALGSQKTKVGHPSSSGDGESNPSTWKTPNHHADSLSTSLLAAVPTGNETYANHVTAIKPSSIYGGTGGATPDAAAPTSLYGTETPSSEQQHRVVDPNASSRAATRSDGDAAPPAHQPAHQQLTDIEESLYGEKISAMEYPLQHHRRLAAAENDDENTVIDAKRRPDAADDEALNNVPRLETEETKQQQQQHHQSEHDVSADPTNGINNNNHHHRNTTNGQQHAEGVTTEDIGGALETKSGSQAVGNYDYQQSPEAIILTEPLGTGVVPHEVADQQYQSGYEYPSEEVATENQYQTEISPYANQPVGIDVDGNPISDPNLAYDAAGNPTSDPNQFYAEQAGDYNNYEQTGAAGYQQPNDGTFEYTEYQQNYEPSGTEYTSEEAPYQPYDEQPQYDQSDVYEEPAVSEQPYTDPSNLEPYQEQEYTKNTDQYVEPSQQSTDQYYAQPSDAQAQDDPYYAGHTQPGDQYYADETHQEHTVYDDGQNPEHQQYADYDNVETYPVDPASADYYATSGENTTSSTGENASQLGPTYADASPAMVGPTDYLASETDDSSAALQNDIPVDGSGGNNINVTAEKSESDFDFSAN